MLWIVCKCPFYLQWGIYFIGDKIICGFSMKIHSNFWKHINKFKNLRRFILSDIFFIGFTSFKFWFCTGNCWTIFDIGAFWADGQTSPLVWMAHIVGPFISFNLGFVLSIVDSQIGPFCADWLWSKMAHNISPQSHELNWQ